MIRQSRGIVLITGNEAKASVRAGDCVEVDFISERATSQRERVWLAVESVDSGIIKGIVLNGPVFMNGMFTDELEGLNVTDVFRIMRVHASAFDRS